MGKLRNLFLEPVETTNSSQSYVYAHNFSNCKVNCMKVGVRIKNQSNMGINANNYGIDFWACRTGVWGNPNGSLFRGSHQSPQYVAGYGYVLTGSKNKFLNFPIHPPKILI